LQADYVTVVEDGPIMSAKYRLPVTLGQNGPTQQSHGLFATAKLLVIFGRPMYGCVCAFNLVLG